MCVCVRPSVCVSVCVCVSVTNLEAISLVTMLKMRYSMSQKILYGAAEIDAV